MWVAFAAAAPPRVRVHAPLDQVSAVRARADLEFIASTPHPVGTVAHDRVRDYLVDRLRTLGCDEVHVQSGVGFDMLSGPLAATVANVVGRKRGTAPGPAIVLMAHYDAVQRSFGAGDNGAAVAALLETLRALQHSPPLHHDLIVVFTDAEEVGMLGAEAFVDLHPWAHDAGVVLNFDGRGDAGPVFMFQTSPGNAALIDALTAAPDPRANSLAGAVYRLLPNNTDLSIWLHARPQVAGLNFAHIGGFPHYHTPIDNLESLDLRVVQQLGDYALSMTQALDRAELDQLTGPTDALYFNVPIFGLIHYPFDWAVPLASIILAITLLLGAIALRQRLMTAGGLGRGMIALVLALALPTAFALGAWRLVELIHPGFADILQGEPYNATWYLIGFGILAVVVAAVVQLRLFRRASLLDRIMPALLAWALLGAASALWLPAGSYLFAWPLLAVLVAATWWMFAAWQGRNAGAARVIAAVAAIPALVIWLPLIVAFESALTIQNLWLCAFMLAWLTVLLALAWPREMAGKGGGAQGGRGGGWATVLVASGIGAGIAALIVAESKADFSATRKHPDSLLYLAMAGQGRAWWVSFDRTTDEWTSSILGPAPKRRRFSGSPYHLPDVRDSLLSREATPVIGTTSPVRVISTEVIPTGKRVHLHIDQIGPANGVWCYIDGPAVVTQMTINGRALVDGDGGPYAPEYRMRAGGPVLRYAGIPPEGLDLQFTLPDQPVIFRVITSTTAFPPVGTGALGPRPASFMSKPFIPTDVSVVEWTTRL